MNHSSSLLTLEISLPGFKPVFVLYYEGSEEDACSFIFSLEHRRTFLQLEETRVGFSAPFLVLIFFSEFRREALTMPLDILRSIWRNYFNDVRVQVMLSTPNHEGIRHKTFETQNCEENK